VRLLLMNGANPNCTSRSNLTPMHVLVFTAGESMMINREGEMKALHFDFVRRLLTLLLQHGLEPNVRVGQRPQYVLQVKHWEYFSIWIKGLFLANFLDSS
jgi:hypothetical protein